MLVNNIRGNSIPSGAHIVIWGYFPLKWKMVKPMEHTSGHYKRFARNKAAIVIASAGILMIMVVLCTMTSLKRPDYDAITGAGLLSGENFVVITADHYKRLKRQSTAVQSTNDTSSNQPRYGLPTPFYLHYIYFRSEKGDRSWKLRFIDYLSIMSGVQFLKPDGVLVHGDTVPEGTQMRPKQPYKSKKNEAQWIVFFSFTLSVKQFI